MKSKVGLIYLKIHIFLNLKVKIKHICPGWNFKDGPNSPRVTIPLVAPRFEQRAVINNVKILFHLKSNTWQASVGYGHRDSPTRWSENQV